MSALRRFVAATAVLGALVAACRVIAGIDDHDFHVADVTVNVNVNGKTSCGRTTLASKPEGSFPTDHDQQVVFALSEIHLPSPGSPYGFDLDSVCTCDETDPSIHDGGTSCALPSSPLVPKGCDFDGGVDDGFANVIGTIADAGLGAVALGLEGKSIRCGNEDVLFVIDDYNGEANDDSVVVSAVRSGGIFDFVDSGTPIDVTECGATGFDSPGFEPYPSRNDGHDTWTLALHDLNDYDAGALTNHIVGYVRDSRLVVDARGSSFVLPVTFARGTLAISTPILTGTIKRDGDIFRFVDGTLAGRTKAVDVVSAFVNGLSDGTGDSCTSPITAIVSDLICSARDVSADPNEDFATPLRQCDAVSVGLSITGVQAQISPTSNDRSSKLCPLTPPCPD